MHVLDYKPDARTNMPIAQLAIYALALARRVRGLKLFDIKCPGSTSRSTVKCFPAPFLPVESANINANSRSVFKAKCLI